MAGLASWLRSAPLLGALLLGCAAPPPAPMSAAPLLRLPPAALGRTLALAQTLTVDANGQSHSVDVLLEADAGIVRIALLNLGQVAARLTWNGTQLQETRAAWWPAAVSGARILSDLQLVWWPAAAVRAALPPGWALLDTPNERRLTEGKQVVSVVRYVSATEVELDNLRDGYRLRIDSVSLDP
jgi:hypothetical protein